MTRELKNLKITGIAIHTDGGGNPVLLTRTPGKDDVPDRDGLDGAPADSDHRPPLLRRLAEPEPREVGPVESCGECYLRQPALDERDDPSCGHPDEDGRGPLPYKGRPTWCPGTRPLLIRWAK